MAETKTRQPITTPLSTPGVTPESSAPADTTRDHLLSLIGLAREFYWEQDEEYRYTLVVGPILETVGVDPVRMVGHTRWEIGAAPIGLEGGWDTHRATLEARKPFVDLLLRGVGTHGEVHYVTSNGAPMFDPGGRFKGYRGITRDVTQRVQMDLRLGIEHGVSRLLAEAEAIAQVIPKIIRLICETLGWTCGAFWMLDEGSGKVGCVAGWGADAPGVEEFLTTSKELPPLAPGEQGLVRRCFDSGAPGWIANVALEPAFLRASAAAWAGLHSAFAVPAKVGTRAIAVMEFFSDEIHQPDAELMNAMTYVGNQVGQFSRRLHAQEQLRQGERRFRATFDQAAVGIAHVGRKGQFLMVNEKMCTMLGYTVEQMLLMTVKDISHPDDRNMTDEVRGRLLRGEIPTFSVDKRYVRRDGSDVWMRITVSVARDANGAVEYDIAVFEDISERRLAEARVIEAERQAAVGHLERELAIARTLQTSILPRKLSIEGFEMAARMETASEVGGDYYEVHPTPDGGCWIGIGDVSGHGLDAGLVMLMIQAGVSSLVARDPDGDPARLLVALNRMLFDNVKTRLGRDDYATLTLLRVHRDGRVAFAGAHEEILMWRAGAAKSEIVLTSGMWVGVLPDFSGIVRTERQRLEPGDVMLLYTDGITEALGPDGSERFGSDRLVEMLEELHDRPAAQICEGLFAKLATWSPNTAREDDQSALVLRFLGNDGGGAASS